MEGSTLNDYGELLYNGNTDNNKNGYGFIIVAILLFVASNFIYAKMMLMIMSGIILLIGLYLLLFNRSEEFSIFEHAITLTSKGQEIVITKEEIDHIRFQEMKVRRSPVVNYYPVLILKDQNQFLINKAFNSVTNKDFKKIITSYI